VSGLPRHAPRPPERRPRGVRHPFAIPAETTRKLKVLARASSVTLFMSLLAAFQSLLSCLTGEDDIVVGSPVAGRNRPETEALIGNFVNTLVLRLRLTDDPTFRETLRRTRVTALGAFANQDVPFEKLVDEIRPPRTLAYHPLFQVWFVLQNAAVERDAWHGVTVESLPVDNGMTRHDLQLTLWETPEGLAGAFIYSSDLFSARQIATMAEQLGALLSLATERPNIRLSELRSALEHVALSHAEHSAEQFEQTAVASLPSIARKPITSVRQRTTE
jgi:non-ribosomal peptide synthetase component F